MKNTRFTIFSMQSLRIALKNIVNNYSMSRTIDYISATVLVLLITLVWSFFLFSNFIGALIFSVCFTAIAIFTIRYVSKKKNKPYSCDRLELEFCIKGNEYVINLLKSAIKNDKIENCCNYILLENAVIIANYKFSSIGISDMCGVCNLTKKLGRNDVFLICKGIERKAYQIADIEKIKVRPVKIKAVYKFLKKHDALPDLKETKAKFSITAVFQKVLARQNFKNYAFSGTILTLVAFITPFKIYYIVFGSISLLLALLCLTPLGGGTISSPKVFELLEREAQDEYRRE